MIKIAGKQVGLRSRQKAAAASHRVVVAESRSQVTVLVIQGCRGPPTSDRAGPCQWRFVDGRVWPRSNLKTQPARNPSGIRELNTVILNALRKTRKHICTKSIEHGDRILPI